MIHVLMQSMLLIDVMQQGKVVVVAMVVIVPITERTVDCWFYIDVFCIWSIKLVKINIKVKNNFEMLINIRSFLK
jgi:hypothetical protein